MLLTFFHLTIFHQSDTHGWLIPDFRENVQQNFPQTLAFYRQYKQKYPNTFVFDSGDLIQDCGLSDADLSHEQGYFIYEMWNTMANKSYIDAVTLGNHDIQLDSPLIHFTNYSAFNSLFVSSNTINNYFLKHKLINKTLTFGFTPEFQSLPQIEIRPILSTILSDPTFKDKISSLTYDQIVILIHQGQLLDPKIFFSIYKHIRDLTDRPIIILGGHEHLTIYNYNLPTAEIERQINAKINKNWRNIFVNGSDVNLILAETENFYQFLTRISIEFEDFRSESGALIVKKVEFEKLHNVLEELEKMLGEPVLMNFFEESMLKTIAQKVEELQLGVRIGTSPGLFLAYNYDIESGESLPGLILEILSAKYGSASGINTGFFTVDVVPGAFFVNDLYNVIRYRNEGDWEVVKELDLMIRGFGEELFVVDHFNGQKLVELFLKNGVEMEYQILDDNLFNIFRKYVESEWE